MPAVLPPHIGIDFGNHSIKLVELKNPYTKPQLATMGALQTPVGVVNSYDQDKKNQLIEAVKQLVRDTKASTKYVVAALPESSVFSRIIKLPKMEEAEVQDAVYWEAKQYTPLPLEELRVGTVPISMDQTTGERRILVIAAPTKLSDLYTEVLEKAGLIPVALESESLSTLRAIEFSYEKTEGITLDFGSQTTDMAIMKNGALYFSQSINDGADLLTKALMNDFQLTYAQAEEYKRTYGLLKNQAEGKVYNSLRVVMDTIVNEVIRGVEFFKSQTGEVPPNTIYLSGDGALLPGLSEYLTEHIGMQSVVVDPWQKINVPGAWQKMAGTGRPAYAITIGLCLKGD